MSVNDIPALERITFFPGQPLHARDLTDVQRSDRELRWLHNRSLHTWGIGIGFGVTGEAGQTAVTIAPGYGTDCLGREVILAEPRVKVIPAIAGDEKGEPVEFFLVAAYQDDDAQQVAERRRGACAPEGTVRLGEEPLLSWKKRGSLSEGHELVLAQVWIQNCRLNRPVSLLVRRSARPSAHPYIAAGQTTAGHTPWTAWDVGGVVLGVTVDVDTSAERFRTTPRYFAHIVGARAIPPDPSPVALPFPQITGATPERFTLRVFLPDMGTLPYNPPVLRSSMTGPDLIRTKLAWRVVWMGVEA